MDSMVLDYLSDIFLWIYHVAGIFWVIYRLLLLLIWPIFGELGGLKSIGRAVLVMGVCWLLLRLSTILWLLWSMSMGMC